MPDEPVAPANPNPEASVEETKIPSILDDSVKPESIIDEAGKEGDEAAQAEEKRIMEADETTLSEDDKTKKATIVETRETKRLMEAKDEDLSAEDKVKKGVLVKAKEEAAKNKTVPEKYEFKVPEGFTLDEARETKISEFFKTHEYSQAQAQAAIDLHVEMKNADVKAQDDLFKKINAEAKEETIKALGADYKEQLKYVAKVRNELLSEDTRQILNDSGLSNHSCFIQDLIKIGKLISESKLIDGPNAPPGSGGTAADKLYGPDKK